MSEERIKDAKVLIEGARWEFAYYVAGYAVECALKACMLSRIIHTGWIFDDDAKKTIEACRTHEFTRLIQMANLRDELNNRLAQSANVGDAFNANWKTVEKWTVDSRYQAKTEVEATNLYSAITQEPDGVLKWIQNYW
jgi:HEPN domain-containing protein